MNSNNNKNKIVDFSVLDNIVVSYALLNEDREVFNSLIGHPLEGFTGILQVAYDKFLAYKKYAVANNAVFYLLSLISKQGELLDTEALLLKAVEEDGLAVVYIQDLKEDRTERFEILV